MFFGELSYTSSYESARLLWIILSSIRALLPRGGQAPGLPPYSACATSTDELVESEVCRASERKRSEGIGSQELEGQLRGVHRATYCAHDQHDSTVPGCSR